MLTDAQISAVHDALTLLRAQSVDDPGAMAQWHSVYGHVNLPAIDVSAIVQQIAARGPQTPGRMVEAATNSTHEEVLARLDEWAADLRPDR
jgi:hypothetical protein